MLIITENNEEINFNILLMYNFLHYLQIINYVMSDF